MSPVRRVRRVIRKIDPWTVLKVSLIFNALIALAGVLGSVVFWSIFVNAGIPDKISEIAEQLTLTFNADGPTYFRVVVLLAVMWTVLATGFFTLGALLYNLITDVVGGIEVVVLEETLVAPPMQVPATGRRIRPAAKRGAVTLSPTPGAEAQEAASAEETAPPVPEPVPAPPAAPAQAPAPRRPEPVSAAAEPASRESNVG